MASSNPMLNDRFFQGASTGGTAVLDTTAYESGTAYQPDTTTEVPSGDTRSMTLGGVVSATAFLLLFVLAGGVVGWQQVTETVTRDVLTGEEIVTTNSPMGWLFGSLIIGFGLAMLTIFKPNIARFTAVPYALAEGVLLGVISHMYDAQWDGIAVQAVVATAGVFLIMLALYSLRVLRVTPRLTKGIIAATGGILVMYLFGWIASIFGADVRFWDSASPMGIGISVLIVGVAAFNLLLDFDFIERGVESRLPARMEWFAAFGLVVTLVWLYLEMLRLLSKLRD